MRISFFERLSEGLCQVFDSVHIPLRLLAWSAPALITLIKTFFWRKMTEVNEVYRTLLQIKSEIDTMLASIESQSQEPQISTQQRLSFLINEFSKSVETLRDAARILDPKSRIVWETRVSRFSEDLKTMRITCDRRLGLLFKSQKEKEDRDYLLANSASGRAGDQQAQLLTESRSLNSSHNMMDAIVDQSRAVLDNLVGQNTTLKNARGKLYDLINNAGMGQTLANSIHSREHADALILYGCMILTVVIFFLLWWFVR